MLPFKKYTMSLPMLPSKLKPAVIANSGELVKSAPHSVLTWAVVTPSSQSLG